MKIIKKISFMLIPFLCSCQGVITPDSFVYEEFQTEIYKLASWQKITDNVAPVRIYIEGDGYAFNHAGQPTSDPTPRSNFVRQLAFNDPNPNVVYLARPCQYVEDRACQVKDWTTGRFSKEIVKATTQAIKSIRGKRSVVLVGYSGGALLSGLVIQKNPNLPVQKWMTIAGVLNHKRWTTNLNLPPLKDSIDLEQLPKVPQVHFVGEKDRIVSL